MKIAIFHDYFGAMGGAEKLALTFARGLGADVITTDVDNELIKKMNFEDVKVISIGKTIQRPILKQVSSCMRFALCDFRKNYDFFIFSGSWAHFAAKRHKPNIYYYQAPVKAFYKTIDLFPQQSLIKRSLNKCLFILLKYLYENYMNHAQTVVVNSRFVQSIIKKYFHRDSEVIYPPINCDQYNFQESGDFWLSVNRISPEKRIELQVEAFRLIPEERLVIVGGFKKGDYYTQKYAEKIKLGLSKNVEMHGELFGKELIDLYSKCKGFISTTADEAFGMSAVEAMASGKPVICAREGGYLETVIDGVTGLLVDPTVEDIIKAIKTISKDPRKYRQACEEQAKKFDTTIFIKQMKDKIQSHLVLT